MLNTASEHIDSLADFVAESPTSLHAAAAIAERLRQAGFEQADPAQSWSSVSGRRFVLRDGAVIAWVAPEELAERSGFRIVGTHTDSPSFKVKPGDPIRSAGWTQVGVEVYGGPLLNSWLDRDLGIAGRVVTRDGVSHLVRTGPVARIPQLAVHLDRGVNDALKLDKQTSTQPVLAIEMPGSLLDHLCEPIEVSPDDVALHDLFVYDTQRPAVIGMEKEFLASGRLDNLACTHGALSAVEDLQAGSDVAVFAAFDHEEVGSATTTGAAGPILQDVLERIAAGYGLALDATRAMYARSSCISADTGHVVHPNYPNHHDPINKPLPNRGPLLKLNANQRYATDGVGAALWMRACAAADVPTQPFVSSNAVPCGSTIGPITATRLGITTVDVGVGLLSMHSARELCGVDDPWYLARAVEAYWNGA
ncbi:M18 family aminopeptidase [Tessaracoccus flavus]|uniref:M18 family aminopeptidase n=1 Tax=Tessaracoccus flavus TaxID=1610493 RepID=A0A1Q2CGC9_9ACTN|nr:M18 family aminopeptidase [Tessaracoccus flavus]AQP45171.1 M18 family aminopeptidase [Tessaracoccus flavus]SDY54324.1 aspartyl aminopeptidase [Tessaracoccus flavus]